MVVGAAVTSCEITHIEQWTRCSGVQHACVHECIRATQQLTPHTYTLFERLPVLQHHSGCCCLLMTLSVGPLG